MFSLIVRESESALKWRRRQMDERERVREASALSLYVQELKIALGMTGKIIINSCSKGWKIPCVCVSERENECCMHTAELLKQPRGVLFIFLLLFKSASKVQKLHLSAQPLSSPLTSSLSLSLHSAAPVMGKHFSSAYHRLKRKYNKLVVRGLDFEQKVDAPMIKRHPSPYRSTNTHAAGTLYKCA